MTPAGELVLAVDEDHTLTLAIHGVFGEDDRAWPCRDRRLILDALGRPERVEVAPCWGFWKRGREIEIQKCGHPKGMVSARSLAIGLALVTGRDYRPDPYRIRDAVPSTFTQHNC